MSRISGKTVIIRKQRKCFGCLQVIKKGDTAYIQTNTGDGKIYTLTFCLSCKDKISKMGYNDEFYEGELRETDNAKN